MCNEVAAPLPKSIYGSTSELAESNLQLKCFTQMPGSTLDPLLKGSWESTDGNGYRRVKAIVDSGASQSVASGSLAPEVEVTPTEGSRRGQTYAGAAKGGKPLQNEGQKVVQALTTEGQQISTTWQVVDVS